MTALEVQNLRDMLGPNFNGVVAIVVWGLSIGICWLAFRRVSSGTAEMTPNYPTIGKAALQLVAGFSIFMSVGMALRILPSTRDLDLPTRGAICDVVSLSIFLFLAFRTTAVSLKETFRPRNVRAYVFAALAPIAFGRLIITFEIVHFIQAHLGLSDFDVHNHLRNGSTGVFSVVVVAIIAPIAEESYFRGILLKGFLVKYGQRTALLASAICFSLYHFSPSHLVPSLISGLVLGWLAVRTSSLFPSILLHILNNVSLICIRASGIEWPFTKNSSLILQPIWFDGLGIILFAGALFFVSKVLPEQVQSNMQA